MKAQIRLSLSVKDPEGHIYALDLLNVVFLGEGLGQQVFSLVILPQGLFGSLLIQLKGQDVVRLEHAVKLRRHHGGVAAVGAAGGCRGGVANKLRPAAGAVIGLHARGSLLVFPGLILLSLLLSLLLGLLGGRLGRLVQLVCIQGLDLLHREAAAAEIAAKLAALPVIAQRSRTGRALIIGDLRGHICPPLVACCAPPPGAGQPILRGMLSPCSKSGRYQSK